MLTVLVLPDEMNQSLAVASRPGLFHVLPGVPALCCDSVGTPILSLTIMLSRRPLPEESSIHHLIQQGVLTLSVGWVIPESSALTGADADSLESYRPIYVRPATFTLVGFEGDILSGPILSEGIAPRASLQAQLDRENTVEVVAALSGVPSRLKVRCHVQFRTAAVTQRVQVSGIWQEIFDWISDWVSDHLDADAPLTLTDVGTMLRDLIDAKVVQYHVLNPDGSQEAERAIDIDQLVTPFRRAASVIIECLTPELEPASPQNCYRLKRRPGSAFALAFEQDIARVGERTLEMETSLDRIFGDSLRGRPTDSHIRLVCVDSQTAGFEPAPRRLRSLPSIGIKSTVRPRSIELAADGNGYRTLRSKMTPGRNAVVPASALVSGGHVAQTIQVAPNLHHFTSNEVVIDRPSSLPGAHGVDQSLPVVDEPSSPIWKDRITNGKYWYAPSFEPVLPSPNSDSENSPFLYSFRQKGHTASGQPGIETTIRFTLRPAMSTPTAEALKRLGSVKASPVAVDGLSVQFVLPFRDAAGATRIQSFPTTLERLGETAVVTLYLIDDWARACYGALAYPGYQTEPARLVTSYSFKAYVAVPRLSLLVAHGGKEAVTPVAFSAAQAHDLDGRTFVDAESVSYCHPAVTLHYNREVPASGTSERPSEASAAQGPASTVALATGQYVSIHPVIAVSPQLNLTAVVADRLRLTSYAVQIMGRQQSTEILYPCNTLGALYRQETDQGAVAVGCQDAFRLGQTTFRQYEEIKDDVPAERPLHGIPVLTTTWAFFGRTSDLPHSPFWSERWGPIVPCGDLPVLYGRS